MFLCVWLFPWWPLEKVCTPDIISKGKYDLPRILYNIKFHVKHSPRSQLCSSLKTYEEPTTPSVSIWETSKELRRKKKVYPRTFWIDHCGRLWEQEWKVLWFLAQRDKTNLSLRWQDFLVTEAKWFYLKCLSFKSNIIFCSFSLAIYFILFISIFSLP